MYDTIGLCLTLQISFFCSALHFDQQLAAYTFYLIFYHYDDYYFSSTTTTFIINTKEVSVIFRIERNAVRLPQA